MVNVPPLYIQEKVHPKALIDDLRRSGEWRVNSGEKLSTDHNPPATQGSFADLFADFNGLPEGADRTEFYQHDGYWQNRMVLGDSLQVMASLSEREGLQGKVQCIYIDPPYGTRFNSNFQWTTTSNIVLDRVEHITREPEQVKAFRDTWRDGIHSYLTYLRDRLTVARDLLADSGSIFVQIGDENVHRVRAVLDEVFGEENFVSLISFKTKKMALGTSFLGTVNDFIVWYAKSKPSLKFRRLFLERDASTDSSQYQLLSYPDGFTRRLNSEERNLGKPIEHTARLFRTLDLHSSGRTPSCVFDFQFHGVECSPSRNRSWKTNQLGIGHLIKADRLVQYGRSPEYKLFFDDYPVQNLMNVWEDTQGASDKRYVVETSIKPIHRCILMATDPGDLVLDPTCGSGTTAYVAEQWGRRWITIDTSRVALALARARIMGARYPYYILADSKDGQFKEAEPPACQSRRLVYSLARMAFPAWATYVYETGYFHGNGVPRHALNPGSQYLRRAPIGASGIRRRDDGLGRYRRLPIPRRQNQHPWASRRPVLSARSMASRSVPKGPCHRLSGSREPFIPWPSLQ